MVLKVKPTGLAPNDRGTLDATVPLPLLEMVPGFLSLPQAMITEKAALGEP